MQAMLLLLVSVSSYCSYRRARAVAATSRARSAGLQDLCSQRVANAFDGFDETHRIFHADVCAADLYHDR